MNKKNIKRIVLISLTFLMFGVFIGYNTGLFDNFLINGNTPKEGTPSPGTGKSTSDGSTNPDITLIENSHNAPPIFNKPNYENQSVVSIVRSSKEKTSGISDEEIFEMTKNAIELAGGLKGIVKDNQTVVLKPNLVQIHVDSTGQLFDKELNGVTTDWRVTKAVADLVRELNPNGKIYVMEGSAADGSKKAMEYLNYTKEKMPCVDEFISIEDDTGEWQDFDSPELVKHSLADALLHKEYYFNKKYLECDVLISIPCLKTTSGVIVSGSIKNVAIGATPANIYGVSATNPGRTKMVSHKIVDGELDKWICDYYICKPVDFAVMDGLVGFQNGPVPMGKDNVTGDRMNMRLIMAGKDSVAVDTIEALTVGWDPESITYLKYLSDRGMGTRDPAKIAVVGNFVQNVRKDFKIRFTNLGGVQIKDKTPPELSLVKKENTNGNINLDLDVSEDTVKVEVLVDDILYDTVHSPDFKKISIDTSRFTAGKHTIRLFAYDRFLNHKEIQVDW